MQSFALQLDLGAIQTIGLIALGVFVLLAILFAVIIKKIVGKIIGVLIMVALDVAVYSQRGNLEACEPGTTCTFFGVDVDVPDPSPDLG